MKALDFSKKITSFPVFPNLRFSCGEIPCQTENRCYNKTGFKKRGTLYGIIIFCHESD
ncbi:hypothetical protein HOLDEFILI_01934 [Holdemania filiformis DSM 12042]|uniref:Uncharacterized protein n=1 Tax=Holdemania filiformis DSM 12042 TaxID=545696 RepID=B9Y7Y9_9FIRM|nr:hypothetical protein HOLDEFILI_01934 [Holdemania filiformis DSM 12042]